MNIFRSAILCVIFAMLAFLGQATTAQATLLAHWDFDSNLQDQAGSNDLTASGDAVVTNAVGDFIVGTGALTLDGTGDFGTATGFKGVTGTTARTMSLWTKSSTVDGTEVAFMNWGSTAPDGAKWTFRMDETSFVPRVEVASGSVLGSTALNDGDWHHVLATWDTTLGAGIEKLLIYVDGAPETMATGVAQTINTASSQDVRIGTDFNSRELNGFIDDAGILNELMSAVEARSIFKMAVEPGLGYDLSDAYALIDGFDMTSPTIDIDGTLWYLVNDGSIGGTGGDVIDLGGGDFELNLDAGNGFTTLAPPVVPEPSSLLLLGLGALGLVCHTRTRRRNR